VHGGNWQFYPIAINQTIWNLDKRIGATFFIFFEKVLGW